MECVSRPSKLHLTQENLQDCHHPPLFKMNINHPLPFCNDFGRDVVFFKDFGAWFSLSVSVLSLEIVPGCYTVTERCISYLLLYTNYSKR